MTVTCVRFLSSFALQYVFGWQTSGRGSFTFIYVTETEIGMLRCGHSLISFDDNSNALLGIMTGHKKQSINQFSSVI